MVVPDKIVDGIRTALTPILTIDGQGTVGSRENIARLVTGVRVTLARHTKAAGDGPESEEVLAGEARVALKPLLAGIKREGVATFKAKPLADQATDLVPVVMWILGGTRSRARYSRVMETVAGMTHILQSEGFDTGRSTGSPRDIADASEVVEIAEGADEADAGCEGPARSLTGCPWGRRCGMALDHGPT